MTKKPSIFDVPPLSQEELDRRERGAQRLKERLSAIPWYAAKAAKPNGDVFFRALYGSCVLAPPRAITKRFFVAGPLREGPTGDDQQRYSPSVDED